MSTTLLQRMSLLWRTFTPAEKALLDAVASALGSPHQDKMRQQIASINRVQRYFEWTEILFYCARLGKPAWPPGSQFANHSEFELASVRFEADGHSFNSTIWSVGGHVFTLVTRPSFKTHCFSQISISKLTIIGDPGAIAASRVDLSEYLPDSYRLYTDSHDIESRINGWEVSRPEETHVVHFESGDFIVLADRHREEWLLTAKQIDSNEIYRCDTDGKPERVSTEFSIALAS